MRNRTRATHNPTGEIAAPGGTRLGELLLDQDLVTHDQLMAALLDQSGSGRRIGDLLVEAGAIDERTMTSALAEQQGVPVVDLRQRTAEPAALDAVPEHVARESVALPLSVQGDLVEVAMADPLDRVALARLQSAVAPRRVQVLAAPATEVRTAIDSSYRVLPHIERQIRVFEATAARQTDAVAERAGSDDAPVVKIIDLLIAQAVRDRASDVHVEPQESRVRIRFRIDGALTDALQLPVRMAPALASRLKIMANMNIVERRRSQDGQITTEVDGSSLDIRVATTPTIWGEKVVLRILDKRRVALSLHDLGMPDDAMAEFRSILRSPFGMLLCAGPTGSGKTTTLYAGLQEISGPERNTMTIEDPVEYVFDGINQIQINEQAGVTFAGGLKAILRQDPDVILVGEIRDVDTARIAVQSALTGHFVLSSLHATDAVSALHRFLDMGIESFVVASSVSAVLGQRLLRRICPSCRTTYQPPQEELAFYAKLSAEPKKTFWRGEGCNFCSHTGYQGRIGVFELLRVSDQVRELIVAGAPADAIRSTALAEGMRPLADEAVRLVREDVTTVAEVLRTVYNLSEVA